MKEKKLRVSYILELMFLLLALFWLAGSPGSVLGAMEPLSAGVGAGDRAPHPEYGLKLEFTQQAGKYLAEVGVDIYRAGKVIRSIHSAGPWLFVDLEPGDYAVVARLEDGRRQGARFTVTEGMQKLVILTWPGM